MSSRQLQRSTTVPVPLSFNKEEGVFMGDKPQAMSPANYQFLLRRPSAVFEEQVEEAILSIGSASSAASFHDTVKNALHLILLNARHSLVFLLDYENSELLYYESSDDDPHPLPKSGILWEAIRRRSATIIKSYSSIKETDPLHTFLPNFRSLENDQVVLINPIVEKKHHVVIALMMVVCDDPSMIQVEKLRWLERNVLVAASRVLKQIIHVKDWARAEKMLTVCGDLIDLDTTSLAVKILNHIKATLEVNMCTLFLLDDTTQELICPVFDYIPLEKEIRVEITSESIYGRCFLTGEVAVLDSVSQDVRFNPTVDIINDYEPSTMMCLPVKSQNKDETIQKVGVAVVCDKKNGKPFTPRDQENMEFVLRFCSSVIANTLAFQRELALKKQNQALLEMARNLFSRLSDLNTLLSAIMNEARSLTKAERCSLFLLDQEQQELVAAVFDSDLPSQDTIRIKVGQGIAGLVAKTGKFVNIKNAYKHPKFFKAIDENTGFRTKNMLCFPIKDHKDKVVGVAELCNKIGGNFFTKYDEEIATTFSVYCGISLYQSQLYNQMTESQEKSTLATELMIYHMQVSSEDVDSEVATPIPACESFDKDFYQFSYSPRSLPENDTVKAVIGMMHEMDLIKQWRIEPRTLARFVLMVKRGYRDPPYHNWQHALSVAHFCAVLYKYCDRLSFLNDLEVVALFVSCLTHDIDHRGTNNAFQVSSKSTLASLYSSEGSVMERHHFAQTACILNTKDCNIFEHLSYPLYKQVLDLIQHNILSTDIAHHLRIIKDVEEMAKVGYQPADEKHHKLMCSLIMTSCDLCSGCKEWTWAKQIANLIYTEFFRQGDLEKALGHTPNEMMDRDKAFIPEQQLGFLDGISGPAYRLLAQLLPRASGAYEEFKGNRKKWAELAREGRRPSD